MSAAAAAFASPVFGSNGETFGSDDDDDARKTEQRLLLLRPNDERDDDDEQATLLDKERTILIRGVGVGIIMRKGDVGGLILMQS